MALPESFDGPHVLSIINIQDLYSEKPKSIKTIKAVLPEGIRIQPYDEMSQNI